MRYLCQVEDQELRDALVDFLKNLGICGSCQGYTLYELLDKERDKVRTFCLACSEKKCKFRTKARNPKAELLPNGEIAWFL